MSRLSDKARQPAKTKVHQQATGESSTFSARDLADLPALARRLQAAKRPIDTWLVDCLSATTKAALAKYVGQSSGLAQLEKALLADLNSILRGGPIYKRQRFAGVILRRKTRVWLRQKPQGIELAHLNRLLLEDAYPRAVSRKPAGKGVAQHKMERVKRVRSHFVQKCGPSHLGLLTKILQGCGEGEDGFQKAWQRISDGESLPLRNARTLLEKAAVAILFAPECLNQGHPKPKHSRLNEQLAKLVGVSPWRIAEAWRVFKHEAVCPHKDSCPHNVGCKAEAAALLPWLCGHEANLPWRGKKRKKPWQVKTVPPKGGDDDHPHFKTRIKLAILESQRPRFHEGDDKEAYRRWRDQLLAFMSVNGYIALLDGGANQVAKDPFCLTSVKPPDSTGPHSGVVQFAFPLAGHCIVPQQRPPANKELRKQPHTGFPYSSWLLVQKRGLGNAMQSTEDPFIQEAYCNSLGRQYMGRSAAAALEQLVRRAAPNRRALIYVECQTAQLRRAWRKAVRKAGHLLVQYRQGQWERQSMVRR